jgi:hypothetical protein
VTDRTGDRGPNVALLLLIPAALIVAKGVAHRRAMWESGWTPQGDAGPGHGHGHGRARGFGGMEAGSFRLPPRIEWMLDTWHARAHEQADLADTTTPETGTA